MEVLRAIIILLAPTTFVGLFWLERRGNFGAKQAAKAGVLLLVLGIGLGYLDTLWSQLFTSWKGITAFMTFERGTIHYFSDFVAMGYGVLAFSIFRAVFPRRKSSDG